MIAIVGRALVIRTAGAMTAVIAEFAVALPFALRAVTASRTPVAEIGQSDTVRLGGRPDDVRARRDVRVAPLPLTTPLIRGLQFLALALSDLALFLHPGGLRITDSLLEYPLEAGL